VALIQVAVVAVAANKVLIAKGVENVERLQADHLEYFFFLG
jgi:hypothetical protein